MNAPQSDDGFVAFFRRYTRTWLHGVSTAALTAFGALAVLHRGFVGVAIAAYVLPPVAMYATGRLPAGTRPDGSPAAEGAEGTDAREAADAASGPSGHDEATTSSRRGDTGEPAAKASRPDGPEGPAGSTATPEDPDGRTESPPAADAPGGDADDASWQRVDAPTAVALNDVAIADGVGYAAGDDGVVIAGGPDGWRTVLTDGPGAAGATLEGVDATDDGGAVWLAGDGGTVARVDAGTDRHVDFTPPAGRTDNLTGVAAAGPAGDEVVLLIDGSGAVQRGRYRDGDLAWDEPTTPGSGSSLAGVVLTDASTGYCCDTNDGVFETTDGGESFRRVGLDGADGTLTDVAASGEGDCLVSADDGVVHRHDDGTWTPVRICDDALDAIARSDERAVACGGRAVYEQAGATADWERADTAAPGGLSGVAVRPDLALAVGADGAVLERR